MVSCFRGRSDGLLLMSLIFLMFDLFSEWNTYRRCYQPIHKWLLMSYIIVSFSRFVNIGGTILSSKASGAFILDMRQKSPIVQWLSKLMWLVIVPSLATWSIVGTVWTVEVFLHTPECMPGGAQLIFLCLWQGLSYYSIVVYGFLGVSALWLEKRLQQTEDSLRQIADPDTVARWGDVSQIEGYASMPKHDGGLTPQQIMGLQGASVSTGFGCEEVECAICLNPINAGDQVRELSGCRHSFHRSCIDLWLIRRADCPLCKSKVAGSPVADEADRAEQQRTSSSRLTQRMPVQTSLYL